MTENGDCCYFPFMFGGNTYDDCTMDGWFQEWCSLTYNYHDDKQWGNYDPAGRKFPFWADFSHCKISLTVKYNFLASYLNTPNSFPSKLKPPVP